MERPLPYFEKEKKNWDANLQFSFFLFPASPIYSPSLEKSYFVMIYVFSSLMSPSIQKKCCQINVWIRLSKNVVKSMCESAYQKMLSNQCVNPPIKKCCQINVWIQSKSLTATQSSWWSYWSLVLAVSSYSSLLWLCATGKSVIHSVYIRTSSWLNGDLVRTTCILFTRLYKQV